MTTPDPVPLTRDRWTAFVLPETFANLRAAPMRTVGLVVLAFVVGMAAVAAPIFEVSSIDRRHAREVEAGSLTWRVRGGQAAGISAATCDALNGVEGVLSAGAAVAGRLVHVASAPAEAVEVVSVTPGYISLLWPGARTGGDGGLLVGATVARRMGLVPLAVLAFDGGSTRRVDQAMGASRRDSAVDRRLFEVVPPIGNIEECLVEARPGYGSAVDDVLAGWFPPSAKTVATPFLAPDSLARSPESELASRWSAWTWAVGAVLVGLAMGSLWYARRGEFALYRLLDLRGTELGVMLLVEVVCCALLPAQVGALAGVAVGGASRLTDPAATLAQLDDVRLVAAMLVLPAVGWVLLRSKSALDLLKGF